MMPHKSTIYLEDGDVVVVGTVIIIWMNVNCFNGCSTFITTINKQVMFTSNNTKVGSRNAVQFN